jgi:hypothetical protein
MRKKIVALLSEKPSCRVGTKGKKIEQKEVRQNVRKYFLVECCCSVFSALKMETVCFPETLVCTCKTA